MIEHWDDDRRRTERSEALAAIAARDGRDAGFARARLARWIAATQTAEAPSPPTNFLPPSQRATWTVPAGQSLYSIPDPRPEAHTDVQRDRLANADLARSIGQATTLSGSTTVVRHDEVGDYIAESRGLRPTRTRDRVGRLSIDWRGA